MRGVGAVAPVTLRRLARFSSDAGEDVPMSSVIGTCPYCGATVLPDVHFCTQCGGTIGPSQATTTLPPRGNPQPWPQSSVVVAPEKTNGLAIAALVCGLIGFSVPAVVCGHVGKHQIDRSGGREKGRGMAIGGLVLGWIQIAVSITLFVALVVFAASFDGSSSNASNGGFSSSSNASPSYSGSGSGSGSGSNSGGFTVVTTTTTFASRPVVGSYHVEAATALRSGTSTSSPQIGSVPAGVFVGIQCAAIGQNVDDPAYDFTPTSDWDRVTYSGVTGYIADFYVTTNKDINSGKIPRC